MCTLILQYAYRAFHNVLHGYKHLQQENQRTYLNGFVHSRRKTECFLTIRAVRCVHHGLHGTHRYDIQVLATHASTWVHRYSSLLQWSVSLGQRGHVAMVGRILCTKCTLHSNHRFNWRDIPTHKTTSPTERPFSLIHSHRLAAEMWTTMKKYLLGKKNWVVPSICTGFVNTCRMVFL